jgi:predicted nucleotidyltransferase
MEFSEKLPKNDLTEKLLSLNLPIKDYAVFGSGPLAVRGLIEFSKDIDIVARGKAWEKAQEYGTPVETRARFGNVVSLFGDKIEIYNAWPNGDWNVDELINTADIIGGIRFVTLQNVLKWKKARNLPKDVLHIKLIGDYLNKL